MKLNSIKNPRALVLFIYMFALALMVWTFNVQAATEASTESLDKKQDSQEVLITTSMGDIKVKLNAEKAPVTVENFLKYVKNKHYNGTIFHRVIPTFMIQGGGHLPDLKEKETQAPIKNEAKNGLSNLRGTIAMARTGEVDSATAQFFINVVDNQRLDYVDDRNYGYAVFGEVTEGMDVVDKIKSVKTTTKDMYADVPEKTILIKSIKVVSGKAEKENKKVDKKTNKKSKGNK